MHEARYTVAAGTYLIISPLSNKEVEHEEEVELEKSFRNLFFLYITFG
jgi:hypothetical protein